MSELASEPTRTGFLGAPAPRVGAPDERWEARDWQAPRDRVLLVHGRGDLAAEIAWQLQVHGFLTWPARSGAEAAAAMTRVQPDVVILDPGLPDAGIVTRLAGSGPLAPAVLLLRSGAEVGVGAGVPSDDVIRLPIAVEELVARVHATLGRRAAAQPPVAVAPVRPVDPLHLDVRQWKAWRDGELLSLTVREFKLLAFLLEHPDEVFTRTALLEAVWGWTVGGTATVTVHVRRLRGKVELDPANPRLIQTVWGVGYRYVPGG